MFAATSSQSEGVGMERILPASIQKDRADAATAFVYAELLTTPLDIRQVHTNTNRKHTGVTRRRFAAHMNGERNGTARQDKA